MIRYGVHDCLGVLAPAGSSSQTAASATVQANAAAEPMGQAKRGVTRALRAFTVLFQEFG